MASRFWDTLLFKKNRALILADFILVYILSIWNLIEKLNNQYPQLLCVNMKNGFRRSRELRSCKLSCAYYRSLEFFFMCDRGIVFFVLTLVEVNKTT